MIEIETQVRVAIRDAVNRKSRKPFYWGGLQGYEQLEAIAQALGALPSNAPETGYLRQLKLRVERVVERFRVNVADLREAHIWLRKIAACLRYPSAASTSDPALSSTQVKQEMDGLLQSFSPTSNGNGPRRLSMAPGTARGKATALICYIATTFLAYLQTT